MLWLFYWKIKWNHIHNIANIYINWIVDRIQQRRFYSAAPESLQYMDMVYDIHL